jgi:hypothetical protein
MILLERLSCERRSQPDVLYAWLILLARQVCAMLHDIVLLEMPCIVA